MPSISGSNVLVIGGSSNIGAAVAKLAAEQGATVSIAASNLARIQNAIEMIEAAVPKAKVAGFRCDVGNDDAEKILEQLFDEVTKDMGGQLDHVVYTAVKLDFKPLSDVTLEWLRQDGQFLFFVPTLIAKIAPRYMKQSYTSSLTFSSGRVAERPLKGVSVLAGWGAALFGLTRTWALDLAPIRVNLVSPGPTITDLQNLEDERTKRMIEMAKTSLLGKVGSADEVGEAYIYLMRDFNNTGSCVSTSGGVLIQ